MKPFSVCGFAHTCLATSEPIERRQKL